MSLAATTGVARVGGLAWLRAQTTDRVSARAVRLQLMSREVAIRKCSVAPLNVVLKNPFPIASCASKTAGSKNVLVTVETMDGVIGYGEGAPYRGISTDSQRTLMRDLRPVCATLTATTLQPWGRDAAMLDALKFSAARAALEMALIDAAAKTAHLSLYQFLNPGCVAPELVTDITIPMVTPIEAARLAAQYAAQGFTRIKVKIGSRVDADVNRVLAVIATFAVWGLSTPHILLDANEGYSAAAAIELLRQLLARDVHPCIFEQPVQRNDTAGLRAVTDFAESHDIAVLADESV